MPDIDRVLEAVKGGSVSSDEIAAILRIPKKSVSAHLSVLYAHQEVKRKPHVEEKRAYWYYV